MLSKKKIGLGATLLANAGLFYFLYLWWQKNVHLQLFIEAFEVISQTAILTCTGIGTMILLLYAKRLACLIDKRTTDSFWIVAFGFGANNILPFRAGDAMKIYFARRYFNVPATKLFMVKSVEKFFDLTALFVIGLVIIISGGIAIERVHLAAIGLLLLTFFFAALFALFLVRHNFKWIEKLQRYHFANDAINFFETTLTNPELKKSVYITAAIWFLTISMMYIYFATVLPDVPLDYIDILALVFVTSLSLGVPTVPGALGVFEAVAAFYLTNALQVSAEKALASVLVLHLCTAIPQIIFMMIACLATRTLKDN